MEFSGNQRALSNRMKAITRRRTNLQRRALTKARLMRMLRGNTFTPANDIPCQVRKKFCPITLRLDEIQAASTAYILTFTQLFAAIQSQANLVDSATVLFRMKSLKIYAKSGVTSDNAAQPQVSAVIYSLRSAAPVGTPNELNPVGVPALADLIDQGTLNTPAKIGFKYPVNESMISLILNKVDSTQPILQYSANVGASVQVFIDGYYCTKQAAEAFPS